MTWPETRLIRKIKKGLNEKGLRKNPKRRRKSTKEEKRRNHNTLVVETVV